MLERQREGQREGMAKAKAEGKYEGGVRDSDLAGQVASISNTLPKAQRNTFMSFVERELNNVTNSKTGVPIALMESGFAADTSEKLDLGYRSGLLSGLHAVVVQRNGTILFERYFAGEDWFGGRPLGHVTFDGSTLHDLRSVTKSITSLIYAIALEQGKAPAPGARLLDFLS